MAPDNICFMSTYLKPFSVGEGRFHPGSKEDARERQHRPCDHHEHTVRPDESLSQAGS